MKMWRALPLAVGIIGAFVFVTSRSQWSFERLVAPVKDAGKAFTGPDRAYTAGLSADELNNIDIYKTARLATVHITSTVLRRGWFSEVYPTRDIGSGFLISEDGRILTNSHVLQGRGGKIQVTLENQDIYEARLLDHDPRNDLALIKIAPKKKLPYLRMGDADHVQVGQKVLAIGNPFGLDGTLTTGIISSLGRNIRDEKNQELEGMIQTDAAINPGNSGGPLLDSQGNVIGINTAIYGPGGNIGIGFAMPINRAKAMVAAYEIGKTYRRPWLGIAVVHVGGDLAAALDLPPDGGLLIQEVGARTPAETAGLRGPRQYVIVGNIELGVGGDLITAIDGKPVDRNDALTRSLGRKRAGESMELTVYRAGRSRTVRVQLGEAPGDAL